MKLENTVIHHLLKVITAPVRRQGTKERLSTNQGARDESRTIRAVLGTTQDSTERHLGEDNDGGSRRDSGRSGQVWLGATEAIRRVAQREGDHLGQPPVFHLDRELCRLQRC